MSHDRPQSFDDFWQFYVREHSRPATRAWHFVGTSLALVCVVAAVASRMWLLLAAALVVGYGLAWAGHFLVEGNRPATFRYPLMSFLCDLKMWFLMLTGRMKGEAARILDEQRG
jgi:hypothetical protein